MPQSSNAFLQRRCVECSILPRELSSCCIFEWQPMTRIYTILKYIAAVLLLTWYTFWLLLYFKIKVVVTSHRCRKILFCRCRRLELRHMVYCSRGCYPSDVVCNRGSRGDLRESHGKRVVFQFPQTVWEVGRRFEHEARERGLPIGRY